MIITPAECSAFAFRNVSCSQAISAALRAAYSSALVAVSHKLLQDPWTFRVAYMTSWIVQRRFSTHGAGLVTVGPVAGPLT